MWNAEKFDTTTTVASAQTCKMLFANSRGSASACPTVRTLLLFTPALSQTSSGLLLSKPATTAQSWLPQNKTLGFPRCATKTPQSFRHIPNVSSRSQQPQELYSLSIPHPRGLMRTETQLAGSKQIHGNSCQRNGNHERKYATDTQIHITLRDEVNRATFRLSLPSVSAETAGISKNKNTREPTTYQIGIQSWFQNLSPPLG